MQECFAHPMHASLYRRVLPCAQCDTSCVRAAIQSYHLQRRFAPADGRIVDKRGPQRGAQPTPCWLWDQPRSIPSAGNRS